MGTDPEISSVACGHALRASPTLFESVFEAAPDAAIVVDAVGCIVAANEQAAAIFGYPRHELVGQPIRTLLPLGLSEVHSSHRATFAKNPHRRQMSPSVDVQARRADGTLFSVQVNLAPVKIGADELVIAVVRDVTEARRFARKLEQSRSLFELVLEAAPDATVVANQAGEIVLANSEMESIFGYARTWLIGQRIEELLPRPLKDIHVAHRNKFAEDPSRREVRGGPSLEARRSDGSLFPVEIRLSPVKVGDEALVIASIRDATERRRIARELERSNQDLRQFAYLASHDLQAPLRTVAGFTEVLMLSLREQGLAESQERMARNIEDGVVRMQLLIRDLLAYSRIDSSKTPAATATIQQIVDEIVRMLEADLLAARATIEVVAPDEIVGDIGQIRQVLQNLIQNSLAHRDPIRSPNIAVTSRRLGGGRVQVSVSDNGEGIAPEHFDVAFEMFRQLKAGRSGTGIGLAVVRRIVERHGGKVWIESELGVGTTVRFTLPRALGASVGPKSGKRNRRPT